MPRDPGRPSKAEAAAETRAALLDAGARLLSEEPVGAVLSQVKAPAVAQRAGRTIGAFYHHWSSQDDYHRDLVAYVLSPDQVDSTEPTADLVREAIEIGAPVRTLIREAAQENFSRLREDWTVPLFLGLWASRGQDTYITSLLRDHYRAVNGVMINVYTELLQATGRTMRSPFTVQNLAVVLNALVEGLTVRIAVDADAVPLDLPAPADHPHRTDAHPDGETRATHETEGWDLFSATCLALWESMTLPEAD